MKIHVNEKDKLMEFWLTNAEKDDPVLRASLKPYFQESKKNGYLAVVFESGSGDLRESVRELLKHNREVIAKRQLAEENKRGHTAEISR